MWVIQIEADRRTYLCYRPVLAKEDEAVTIRVAELHTGPPSMNDVACIQNYLNSYKAVPCGK